MGRQLSASDDEVMQAALRVMVRRGHDAFTLSEVAKEVGLSRAALILRFRGTQALKVSVTAHIVERFVQSLQTLPASRSGDGLLELVAFIGRMIPTPGNLTAYMRRYYSDADDPDIVQLELKRAQALRAAISKRMPPTGIPHRSAVLAFNANLGGSLLAWEVEPDTDACSYLVERTKQWLTLARVPHNQQWKVGAPKTPA